MKSVFLFPNVSKDNIDDAVLKVLDTLKKFDVHVFVPNEYKILNAKNMNIEDFKGDMIITLGGDGTMLTAINKCQNIPIIGINLGHLGFLTELEITELCYLETILNNEFTLDNRMVLELSIVRDNVEIIREIALNDVIIKTEDSFRIVNIEVYSNGKEVLDFGGDGIIVATSTGSTAYSLAAGGPIIEPDFEAICVTPICSHKLSGKSFVFSNEREIIIKIEERNQNIAFIAVDGNHNVRIYPTDIIKITKSEKYIPFIRVKGQTFFDVFKQKIGG
ncbi:MAG: NAD(+)/NADH kinase [Clostridia bacterium]